VATLVTYLKRCVSLAYLPGARLVFENWRARVPMPCPANRRQMAWICGQWLRKTVSITRAGVERQVPLLLDASSNV